MLSITLTVQRSHAHIDGFQATKNVVETQCSLIRGQILWNFRGFLKNFLTVIPCPLELKIFVQCTSSLIELYCWPVDGYICYTSVINGGWQPLFSTAYDELHQELIRHGG